MRNKIVVTGGAGFIGSNLLDRLVLGGYVNSEDIYNFDTKYDSLDKIYNFLLTYADEIECIFHLGAITDTTEMDRNKFDEYNVGCSIFIWQVCANHNIPLIYASSAATYGDGSQGFDDEMDIIRLEPLNPYGWSKQQFDVWVETQEKHPLNWYGLKFFNVYGYGEAHKGKMASVVFHAYNQIMETGGIKLFRSHNPKYRDGEQLRDFVYVDDIVDVCIWMYENRPASGIYNVGTGKARTFNDLVNAVFTELHKDSNISYIDTPIKIRDKYQYFTEATIDKLRSCGYSKPFHELEEGVKKYIEKLKNENFLKKV